jgi:hypothetical protein
MPSDVGARLLRKVKTHLSESVGKAFSDEGTGICGRLNPNSFPVGYCWLTDEGDAINLSAIPKDGEAVLVELIYRKAPEGADARHLRER